MIPRLRMPGLPPHRLPEPPRLPRTGRDDRGGPHPHRRRPQRAGHQPGRRQSRLQTPPLRRPPFTQVSFQPPETLAVRTAVHRPPGRPAGPRPGACLRQTSPLRAPTPHRPHHRIPRHRSSGHRKSPLAQTRRPRCILAEHREYCPRGGPSPNHRTRRASRRRRSLQSHPGRAPHQGQLGQPGSDGAAGGGGAARTPRPHRRHHRRRPVRHRDQVPVRARPDRPHETDARQAGGRASPPQRYSAVVGA